MTEFEAVGVLQKASHSPPRRARPEVRYLRKRVLGSVKTRFWGICRQTGKAGVSLVLYTEARCGGLDGRRFSPACAAAAAIGCGRLGGHIPVSGIAQAAVALPRVFGAIDGRSAGCNSRRLRQPAAAPGLEWRAGQYPRLAVSRGAQSSPESPDELPPAICRITRRGNAVSGGRCFAGTARSGEGKITPARDGHASAGKVRAGMPVAAGRGFALPGDWRSAWDGYVNGGRHSGARNKETGEGMQQLVERGNE